MLGKHCMKHWSSTQTSISLSSGEAEFAGVIRGAGHGFGHQALLKDVGVDLPLRVWTDSSAAIGICSRQGLGKLRHLDTHTLWIQQAVRTKRVDLRKVDGECNPADILTKHSISRQRLESLITLYGCRYLDGRAESAPLVKQGSSSRTTMAQADDTLANVDDDDGSGANTEQTTCHGSAAPPTMPHVELTQEELDEQYPTLVPPPDELLDDLTDDLRDTVYQKGLVIADAIRSETSLQGRMRRPLIAALQQRGQSSDPVRASTIRPLGGGVIGDATTLRTTATAAIPTTTTEVGCGLVPYGNSPASPLSDTTTTTTGEKRERCRVVVVGGARRRQARELHGKSREQVSLYLEQIQACTLASFCGSNKSSEKYFFSPKLQP
jgi:hypothetical protein